MPGETGSSFDDESFGEPLDTIIRKLDELNDYTYIMHQDVKSSYKALIRVSDSHERELYEIKRMLDKLQFDVGGLQKP